MSNKNSQKNGSPNLEQELVHNDPAQTIAPPYLTLQQVNTMPEGQEKFIRNMDYARVIGLADLVEYRPGEVVSRTLVQNDALGITLFAIPKDEGISAHKSKGDAMVLILDGEAEISIDDEKFQLHSGECIVMPAGHPHALKAVNNFKMLLTVVFKGD